MLELKQLEQKAATTLYEYAGAYLHSDRVPGQTLAQRACAVLKAYRAENPALDYTEWETTEMFLQLVARGSSTESKSYYYNLFTFSDGSVLEFPEPTMENADNYDHLQVAVIR